ncbi:MAG: hypothetical protein JF585_12825 [Burkholderiales bacterium]|nr:hypothetical protein [Burkholderiales bacterium]
MNTTTSPSPERSIASGIHRGVWIGGGLMALTIIALATTLVVKSNNNDALPDTAAGPSTATVVAANTAPDATAPEQSSVAKPAPVHESTRPVHHTPAPVHHEAAQDNAPQQVAAAPVCTTCGVIDGYSAVKIQGQNKSAAACWATPSNRTSARPPSTTCACAWPTARSARCARPPSPMSASASTSTGTRCVRSTDKADLLLPDANGPRRGPFSFQCGKKAS